MQPWRRIVSIAFFAALAMVFVSCGSSGSEVGGNRIEDSQSDDQADGGNESEGDSADGADAEGDESSGDEASTGDDATSDADQDPAAGDDPAATGEPADPSVVLPEIVSQVIDYPLNDEETDCMVKAADGSQDLTELVNNWANPALPPSEPAVLDFADAIQGCIPANELALDVATGWGLVGNDVGDTSPTEIEPPTLDTLEGADKTTVECFTDEIEGANGADVYSTLFVRLIGYDTGDRDKEPAIDAMTKCAPPEAIANSVSASVEQASGFIAEVDPECAVTAVEGKQKEFWTAVLTGEQTGIQDVQTAIEACASDLDDGLLDAPPEDWKPWSGDHTLAEVSPPARNDIYSAPPEMTIDPEKTYTAVIKTGDGEIHLELYADKSPVTVNNFVNLANDGFYDGLSFHRVIDGFMAQGGDPTGLGSGGPGYEFEDEVDNGLVFDSAGLLAMANAGPGTNGSQFFITFEATDFLDGLHTIFGEVTEGEDIVNDIERRDPQLAASRGQVIESITVTEGE